MPNIPRKKKPRKLTDAEMAELLAAASSPQNWIAPETILAEAAQRYVHVAPEWREITRTYSIPELIEAVREMEKKPKRKKGRPGIGNKQEILEAAAQAKVRQGQYTHIAARWKLTRKQLTDLVRNNGKRFKSMVEDLRKRTV